MYLIYLFLRYVNCARNNDEQNMVAFQYQGGILYRCCQSIKPGQELLLSYEEEYAEDLSITFGCLNNKKCTDNGNAQTFLNMFNGSQYVKC